MNITSIPWWKRLFTGSIKARIVAVYAATALVIGLIYSCCMIFILLEAEAQLMTSTMESMLMETIQDDLSNGNPPELDSFSHLYIEHDAIYEIPERFRNLPSGYSEYTDGEDLHIFVSVVDGKKYVLTRSQYEFENWERQLFIEGIALLSAIVLVTLVLGFWIARRSFRPMDLLLDETRRLNRALKEGRLEAGSFSGQWAQNEIGELAESFQITTDRLHQLLISERQFVSEVSHELRTPLTVISTSIELLEQSKNLDLHERQILQRASRTVRRMKELVGVFLNLVRHDTTHAEKIAEIADIIEENEPVWRHEAEARGLQLIIERHGAPHTEKYNAILLASVLNNLVFNAIRYTAHGHVRIVLEPHAFSVIDTGSGISAAEKERIFDTGYRGESGRRQEMSSTGKSPWKADRVLAQPSLSPSALKTAHHHDNHNLASTTRHQVLHTVIPQVSGHSGKTVLPLAAESRHATLSHLKYQV